MCVEVVNILKVNSSRDNGNKENIPGAVSGALSEPSSGNPHKEQWGALTMVSKNKDRFALDWMPEG